MGNSNSSEALDFEYNVTASDYAPVRKFQDFLLGEFFEIKHNTTDELLLMKVRVTSDKNQYQQMIESCFQRVSLLHKNLVKFHGYAGREASGTFSTTYKLYLYFHTLPKDLARIIKARKGTSSGTQRNVPKNYFSETELHRIMTQLIEVMEFLQVNGISHGDVRPEACFLGDDGTFKIADRRLLYEEDLNYRAEKSSDKNYLFSPLALDGYVKGEKETKENRFKGDVFSVGMTLLECGTFRRSANIYEWGGQPSINKDSLFARLNEMQNRYSPRMVQIIAEMLRFEEPVRPDFVRLKRWIAGLEPVGIINSNSSSSPPRNPHKKNDSSPSRLKGSPSPGKSQYGQQQFNKGTIGPKLSSGATPMGGFEQTIKLKQSSGKLSSKQLAREETQMDGSPTNSPSTAHFMRKATLGNEEDEVVEFETEETPKKVFPPGINGHLDPSPVGLSHRVVDVSVLSSPYYPQNNALSNNVHNTSPIKPANSEKYFFSNTQYQQVDNKAQGHLGDVAVTDIKESTFGRADLKGLLGDFNKNDPKYTSSTSSPFQNTSTFGTSATANNKASPVRVFAGENPLRATPSTSDTAFFNPKDPLLAPKNYSTGYNKADSGSLSNLTASTRNSEINRFSGSPQLDSPGKPSYGLKIIAETPKASNPGSISHGNYSNLPSPFLLSPIPQNSSPGLGGETHFYHNYHNSGVPMGSQNKLDTSLGYDHGIDPENWRSLVVDGMTYNSILSVGSEVSPMLGSQNDLLAQLQSKNNLNYQYSLSNADHILKGTSRDDKNYRGSRTSIDGLDGPEEQHSPTKLKHYVKSGYSMQGSRSNVMSGFQTPEEKQGYSSVPGTSRTSGYALSQFNKDLEMDERFRQAMERSKETFSMMKNNNNWDTNLTNKIY